MGFFERVYEQVKRIPRGKVTTYGQIAAAIGEPKKAKIVGWALHSNPSPGIIPCHRVVNKYGELSGGFAFGGIEVQRQLLENEGIAFTPDGRVNLDEYFYSL